MATEEIPLKKIIEWLLNGVTYREVQERLSWLGFSVTIEDINKIVEQEINHRKA